MNADTSLCARPDCHGCPVCADERRAAIAARLATPDPLAYLVRAEVLRVAPHCGVDTKELSARPCSRTWWEWLALSLRGTAEKRLPLPVVRAHHDVANACTHAASEHYGTAAATLALASGETLTEWRDRVRAQIGAAS